MGGEVKARTVIAQAGIVRADGIKYTAEALRRTAALQPDTFRYDEETGSLTAEVGVEMFPTDPDQQWQLMKKFIMDGEAFLTNYEVLQLEIGKLELRSGDILVAKMLEGTHRERVKWAYHLLEKIKPVGVAVALFVGDIEFTVVQPEEH